MTDGGYIAIRGFLFQFDKTIQYVLDNQDKEIYFESNQDIDFDDTVIQVKNHADSKYFPSKIRKPIVQLLELYKQDNAKSYILYAHFSDKNPQTHKNNKSELNKILGKDKDNFDDIIKEGFIKKFTIEFCGDYQTQYNSLIVLLESIFSCSTDEAKTKHLIIGSYIQQKVVQNENQTENRKISFSEIQNYLAQSDKNIFRSTYESHLGATKYEKLLLEKLERSNFWRQNNVFVLGHICKYEEGEIINIIKIIKDKYRKNKANTLQYIILDFSKDYILKIKENLVSIGIGFYDGYEDYGFNKHLFDEVERKNNKYHSIVLLSQDCYKEKVKTDYCSKNFFTKSIVFNSMFDTGFVSTYIQDIKSENIISLLSKLP